MSLYIIAIGGTGSKCVEALVHVAAAGLLDEETVRILFIEPDEANGNLDRTLTTIHTYQSCYQVVARDERVDNKQCPWMTTKIELFNPPRWSPINKSNNTLGSVFNYNDYIPEDPQNPLGHPIQNLIAALYTEDERETRLNIGFRGRPAIGSAVMSQLDLYTENILNQRPWPSLLEKIETDIGGSGKEARIFLCGSAFGGTGASGFPTLGRLIHNWLDKNERRNNVKLGGVILLPYFEFSSKEQNVNYTWESNNTEDNSHEEIYARPENFLLNTAAALRYYKVQAEGVFDTIYLLGNENLSTVNHFSLGGGKQKNDPHFIELYAALAVRHFLNHKPTERGEAVLISRRHPNRITWEDLPEGVESKLVNTTRFAFAWVTSMSKSLEYAKEINFENFPRVAPWSIDFFSHRKGRKGLPEFDKEFRLKSAIDEWCQKYLEWLASLHKSTGNRIQVQLFNREALLKSDSANFYKLLADEKEHNEKDTIQRLKTHLRSKDVKSPNTGVVGLARALYVKCGSSRRKWW